MTTLVLCERPGHEARSYPEGLPHCDRCGKHGAPGHHHPGICTRCNERPAMKKQNRTGIFCERCVEEIATPKPVADPLRIFR